jgi:hypothetical protein
MDWQRESHDKIGGDNLAAQWVPASFLKRPPSGDLAPHGKSADKRSSSFIILPFAPIFALRHK